MDKPKGNKGIIKSIIMIIIGAGLFYYIYKYVEIGDMLAKIRETNYKWVGVAAAVALLAHGIRAWRWMSLLKAVGYKVPFRRSFYAVMVGYLVNVATARGGEVFRCAMLLKTDDVKLEKSTGTIVASRVIDLVILAFFTILTLVVNWNGFMPFLKDNVKLPSIAENLPLLLIMVVVILLVSYIIWKLGDKLLQSGMSRKFIDIIKGFVDGFKSVLNVKSYGLFIMQSLGIWICYMFSAYFLLLAFDFTSHMGLEVALVILVLSALGIIIPLPGSLGAAAVVVLGLEKIYGLTSEQATAYGGVMTVYQILLFIVVGGISFFLYSFEKDKRGSLTEESHEEESI